MKNNCLLVFGILLYLIIPMSYAACSDPAAPYVDWRGCDKRGITLVGDMRSEPFDMTGALIDGARFDGATLHARFTDLELGIQNVSFENAKFIGYNGGINYPGEIKNVSFKNATFENTLYICGNSIINMNFDNVKFTGTMLLPMPLLSICSYDTYGNQMKDASFKNLKSTIHISGFKHLENIDFTGADFTAGIKIHNLPIYGSIIDVKYVKHINLTNTIARYTKFPIEWRNNQEVNFDNTDLQLAYLGIWECQKGSIGRCWTMRDLHPIKP